MNQSGSTTPSSDNNENAEKDAESLKKLPIITDWPALTDIDSAAELSQLPIDSLPDVMRDMAKEMADAQQLPVNMVVGTMLSLVAIATMNTVRVEACDGYVSPVILCTLIICPSATRKTTVRDLLYGPLLRIDTEMRKIDAEKMYARAVDIQNLEDEIKATIASSASTKSGQPLSITNASAAASAAALLADLELKKLRLEMLKNTPQLKRRFIRMDATPARIASDLQLSYTGFQPILSDEASVLKHAMGLHNGGQTDVQIFTQGGSGNSIEVARKGDASDSPVIVDAAVPQWLAIQSDVYDRVRSNNPDLTDTGFLARFAVVYSNTEIGDRDHTKTRRIDPLVKSRWDSTLERVARSSIAHIDAGLSAQESARQEALAAGNTFAATAPDERVMYRKIPMDSAGYHAVKAWRNKHESKLKSTGSYANITAWFERAETRIKEIAYVFDAVESSTGVADVVTLVSVQRAIDIVDVLTRHALKDAGIAIMHGSSHARDVLDWLRVKCDDPKFLTDDTYECGAGQQKPISLRTIKQSMRNKKWVASSDKKIDPILMALEELRDLGYVALRKSVPDKGGPSTVWVFMRPELFTK